jgi:ribosomal protein S8
MVTDPVADIITRIRNAGLAGHKTVVIPTTKMSFDILHILRLQNCIESFMYYGKTITNEDHSTGSATHKLVRRSLPNIPKKLGKCLESIDESDHLEGLGSFAYPVDGINSSRCIFPPFIESNSLNGAFLVFLSYVQKKNYKKQPKIETLKRISTSSHQIYWKFENMPRIQDGFGFAILTTSNFGIITDDEARKKRVGGEVLIAASRRV